MCGSVSLDSNLDTPSPDGQATDSAPLTGIAGGDYSPRNPFRAHRAIQGALIDQRDGEAEDGP